MSTAVLRRMIPSTMFLMSWVMCFLVVDREGDFLLPHPMAPSTQLVVLSPGVESDIVSIVPVFVRALVIAGAGLLLTEIAKGLQYRLDGYRISVNVFIVVFQIVLAFDVLRFYAYDWFLYVLHVLTLIDLDPDAFFLGKRLLPLPSSYPSLVVLVLLVVFLAAKRSDSDSEVC